MDRLIPAAVVYVRVSGYVPTGVVGEVEIFIGLPSASDQILDPQQYLAMSTKSAAAPSGNPETDGTVPGLSVPSMILPLARKNI